MSTQSPKSTNDLIFMSSSKTRCSRRTRRTGKQELADYENLIPAGVAAVRRSRPGKNMTRPTSTHFAGDLQQFDRMSSLEPPLVIPPQNVHHGGLAARRRRAAECREGEKSVRQSKITPTWPTRSKAETPRASIPRWQIIARRSFPNFPRAAQGARGSFLQPDGAVLQRDGHLHPRRTARGFFVVQFVGNAAPLCGLADCAGIFHPHDGLDLSHGARRPAAGDESLFVGDFHRLGRGRARTHPGKIL